MILRIAKRCGRALPITAFLLVFIATAKQASAQALDPEVPGWSRGAGISGISISAGVLSLGLASELTRDHLVPSLPLGIATTVLFAVDVPITFLGGVVTRARTGVPGVPALRVLGWVLYGVAMAGAGSLIGLGVANREPPSGLIAGISTIATAAGVMFSVDDLLIHRQAKARLSARSFGFLTQESR